MRSIPTPMNCTSPLSRLPSCLRGLAGLTAAKASGLDSYASGLGSRG